MTDQKLGAHVLQASKTRDPGFRALVRKYNAQRDDMKKIIARQKDGAHRILPAKIEIEGLFKLDVDNEIWQQTGLDDNDGLVGDTVPDWMKDEQTCKEICARLLLDCCLEEESRLCQERCNLQKWMLEEWHATTQAHTVTSMLIISLYVAFDCSFQIILSQ